MAQADEDKRLYKVVVNHEEQYSIWLADREPPRGWSEAGKTAPRQECLDHIATVWIDMRPASLRKKMEEWARSPDADTAPDAAPSSPPSEKNELVARLEHVQPVEAAVRPDRTAALLKDQIDRGLVFMRFVRTGTEVGVRLDREACDFSTCDFATGAGTAKVVGHLVLNYNQVRYSGVLDIADLSGAGRLEYVGPVGLAPHAV